MLLQTLFQDIPCQIFILWTQNVLQNGRNMIRQVNSYRLSNRRSQHLSALSMIQAHCLFRCSSVLYQADTRLEKALHDNSISLHHQVPSQRAINHQCPHQLAQDLCVRHSLQGPRWDITYGSHTPSSFACSLLSSI